MQTFLPYPSFSESAACLDNRRLNKQITETMQIAKAITDPGHGWRNHPAVEMWRGHVGSLLLYGVTMYYEWRARYNRGKRGGKLEHKAGEWLIEQFLTIDVNKFDWGPSWLGDPAFHASHRAALLRKGLEDETFGLHHIEAFQLGIVPAKKSLWKPVHYAAVWARFGMPQIEDTHYGQFGWAEQPAQPDTKGRLPYVWPTS